MPSIWTHLLVLALAASTVGVAAPADVHLAPYARPVAEDAPAEVRFSTDPLHDAVFTLHVAKDGPVRLGVWVHAGVSRGMVLTAPGDCDGRAGPQALAVTLGGQGGAYQTYACGRVPAGDHEVRVHGGVVLDGTLKAEGGTWTPS